MSVQMLTVEPRPPFPTDALEGCETALVLFAAAFHGCQDAAWIAQAGMRATCVDEDEDKLREMMALYPADWAFRAADVYSWADPELTPVRYDVVTADPWTNQFGTCAAMLPRLCELARRAVVIGTGRAALRPPTGWRVTGRLRRSRLDGGVYWTTLEPA